ncbi:MAG: hypothetical protein CL925_11175 [Deltaproteobacteria bacterium]|nr:hypothetical protein [Deltaproteobacteria bacterium]
MIYLGIDGCRAGWLAVSSEYDSSFSCEIHSSLEKLLEELPEKHQVLIDIPIGLPKTEPRLCDRLARQKLGPRRSSVFSPPCREALFTKDYREACQINETLLGKKLSIQTWNICPKIQEADLLFQNHEGLIPLWKEAHPELAFQAFNKGDFLKHSKKSLEGRLERKTILRKFFKKIDPWFDQERKDFSSKFAAADDLLDALILCIAATERYSSLKFLPDLPKSDETGLPMQICYPGFKS